MSQQFRNTVWNDLVEGGRSILPQGITESADCNNYIWLTIG